jgi:hypothetical protein
MLKRVGVLALMLSAGAVFLQPTAAFAEERSQHAAYSGDRRYNSREVRAYREPVRRDTDDRGWRERGRIEYRNERGYYAPAPTYYYAPAPNCGYRY